MTIKGNGYFTLDNNINGVLTIIGTDDVQFADVIAEAPSGKCYVTGSLINETPQAFQLKIIGLNKEASTFTIPAYAGIKFTKMPLTQLLVAVNGTIRLRALGFIVDPEPKDDPVAQAMLNTNSGLFIEPDQGRSLFYDTQTHTDITTATTTTILDPTNGFTGRLRSISVEVASACHIQIEYTDADGTSNVRIIRDLRFTAGGTYVVDLGDKGQHIINGVNGLLRAITSAAVVVDIDVVSRAD